MVLLFNTLKFEVKALKLNKAAFYDTDHPHRVCSPYYIIYLCSIDKSLITFPVKAAELTRPVCHWPWKETDTGTQWHAKGFAPATFGLAAKSSGGVACVGCYWIFKIYRFLCAHEKKETVGVDCYLCRALNSNRVKSPASKAGGILHEFIVNVKHRT